jgi:hypothetical protein
VIETSSKEGTVVRGSKSSYCDPSQLYLAQYHEDGNWYRAAVTKKLDGQKEVCHGIAANVFHISQVFVFVQRLLGLFSRFIVPCIIQKFFSGIVIMS